MSNLSINKAIPLLIPALDVQEENPSKDLKFCEGELQKWQMAEKMLEVIQVVSFVSFFIFAFAPLPSGILTQNHSSFMIGSFGAFVLGTIAKKQQVNGPLEFYNANIDALTFKLTGKTAARQLSTIERIYKYASLHLQALYQRLFEDIKTNPLRGIKGTFVAPSYNRAKFADIAAYIEPKVDYQMIQVAARNRVIIGPAYSTTPFMQGVCFGSCMTFAHTYFKTASIETAAGLFTEGAPLEAVELQGKVRNLYNVKLGHNAWVWDRDTFAKQKIELSYQTALHVAGFTIVDHKGDLSYAAALEAMSSLKEGVHALSIPVFMPILGGQTGRHALLVLKEGDTCTLFDPNHGTVMARGNGHEMMRELFSHYNTDRMDDAHEGYKICIDTIVPFTTPAKHFNQDVTVVGRQWDRSTVAREQHGDL